MIARLICFIGLAAGAEMAGAQGIPAPPGYRPPVIAKAQMVFSMVAHHHHVGDRVFFYNTRGVPPGNTHYAVPMLVYEPLVTLYNPYDDDLVIDSPRVRISDPPVGFRFKKNDNYLRQEGDGGVSRTHAAEFSKRERHWCPKVFHHDTGDDEA